MVDAEGGVAADEEGTAGEAGAGVEGAGTGLEAALAVVGELMAWRSSWEVL